MDFKDFFAYPYNVTIWQILNSQFLTTLLAAIFGFILIRYDRRVRNAEEDIKEDINILQYKAEADKKEKELDVINDVSVTAESSNNVNYRDEVAQLVGSAKKYLDEIVKNDNDGRHKRTYDKISRYDYSVLAVALHKRARIDDKQLQNAIRIFSEWHQYSKGRAAGKIVPESVFQNIQNAYNGLHL